MIKHRAAARTTPSVRRRHGRAGLRKDRSSEANHGLQGIPEWEAMKALRRNLSHADAVDECSYLSNQYRRMWRAMTKFEVDLRLVLRTLRKKKIPFVLTGAHGISGWTGRPRSTHDVDILVRSGRNYSRAVAAMRSLYPNLETRLLAGVTAFFVPGEKQSVIDVTYPHRDDQRVTLEKAIWVEEGGEKYRVPSLETALANKYGAMLTPTRDPAKRLLDVSDFMTMVKHSTDEGREPIDLQLLAELGEKVWPGGGGEEIIRFVADAKAGRMPYVLSGRERARKNDEQ
jgi:hypothetical protein